MNRRERALLGACLLAYAVLLGLAILLLAHIPDILLLLAGGVVGGAALIAVLREDRAATARGSPWREGELGQRGDAAARWRGMARSLLAHGRALRQRLSQRRDPS
jgi:hypothetical protein